MINFTVSGSFPLLNFLLNQTISLIILDQFLSFTDNLMVVSFEEIYSRSLFVIMRLAYQDLKLENVFVFFYLA